MKINTEYFESLELLLGTLRLCGLNSAVIAGGAIRDALAGKSIADIDVFYSQGDTLNTGNVYFTSKFEVQPPSPVAQYDNVQFEVTHNLTSNLPSISNPIQLIKTKTKPEEWVGKFPHSISRCMLTKEGLVIPVECLADFHNKQMFLYEYLEPTNPAYLAKIKSKYYDWEIVS